MLDGGGGREGVGMASAERLLTVDEVAERLRVAPETVRRWLRAGRLKGTRLGGTKAGYRVAEADVRAFLERGDPQDAGR